MILFSAKILPTGDSVSAEPRHEVIMMIRNAIWPTRKSGEAIHWHASDAPADPSARHSTSLLHLHSPGVSSAQLMSGEGLLAAALFSVFLIKEKVWPSR